MKITFFLGYSLPFTKSGTPSSHPNTRGSQWMRKKHTHSAKHNRHQIVHLIQTQYTHNHMSKHNALLYIPLFNDVIRSIIWHWKTYNEGITLLIRKHDAIKYGIFPIEFYYLTNDECHSFYSASRKCDQKSSWYSIIYIYTIPWSFAKVHKAINQIENTINY